MSACQDYREGCYEGCGYDVCSSSFSDRCLVRGLFRKSSFVREQQLDTALYRAFARSFARPFARYSLTRSLTIRYEGRWVGGESSFFYPLPWSGLLSIA